MWMALKRLFGRSRFLNYAFGNVVLETDKLRGQSRQSLFQWRVKRTLDGNEAFISLKMIPDAYQGPEGRIRNYIEFNRQEALEVKRNLEACLAELNRLQRQSPDQAGGAV